MNRAWLERRFTGIWYGKSRWSLVLLPLSWLYCLVVVVRRFLYRSGTSGKAPGRTRLLVVGNITVGGSGKTPLVIALVQLLERSGIRTGIVTRGYAGKATQWPQQVNPDSDPGLVGDEAVLLAGITGRPVFAGPDRTQAVRALLQHAPIDVVLSDDGLQHYRMWRDLEICVIDAQRGLGNGRCLPAGPLREPASRLNTVDLVVTLGEPAQGHWIRIRAGRVCRLSGAQKAQALDDFCGKTVHAVAAIGNPQRFFNMLRQAGIKLIEHHFRDHHAFRPADLQFNDHLPVLMTAKDAVKCAAFAESHWWFVTAETELDPALEQRVLQLLAAIDNRK